MVNGSSSTSRVSSNFAPARSAPGVHSAPCRRFYFLQMESELVKCPQGELERGINSPSNKPEMGSLHRKMAKLSGRHSAMRAS